MVLKLRITLQISVHQNFHLLAFSDRPPNEVPDCDPFFCGEMVNFSFPFCCREMVKCSFLFCCSEMVKCSFPFCCGKMVKYTLVTTNIQFARVLSEYPPHANWIPSASSSLRCPIPLGSVSMYYWMPFFAPCVLIPNTVRILLAVHSIGGASDASILL